MHLCGPPPRTPRRCGGSWRNIVVLTRDIFAAPATLGDDVRVAVTVFDGKVVYRR